MAEIIEFPGQDLELEEPSLDRGMRLRCLTALRFLFNSIRTGTARPSKLMVIYENSDPNRTIHYLNFGYRAGEFTDAVVQVQRDMLEKRIASKGNSMNPLKN